MLKLKIKNDPKEGYSICESNNPTLFPKRQAQILYKGKDIGIFGIVHPKVLHNYAWPYPTSILELNIEYLINETIIKAN